jgi:hypothetical protein
MMSIVNQDELWAIVNRKLLASVASERPRGCFYGRLDGDPRRLLDACADLMGNGKAISAGKLHQVLAREFAVQTSESALRRHLRGICRCGVKEAGR